MSRSCSERKKFMTQEAHLNPIDNSASSQYNKIVPKPKHGDISPKRSDISPKRGDISPKRGDIFLVRFDGIGSEQHGLRPAVVLQNDTGNQCSPTVLVAPLSSRCAKRLPTHVFLSRYSTPLKADSIALLEQVRVIDKTRLLQSLGRLPDREMSAIDKALLISFGLVK